MGPLLATSLGGTFVEGDEHADPCRPWYGSSLSTARSIVQAVLAAVGGGGPVVVAYPLRCIDWVFHRRRLAERGVGMTVVSLTATYEETVEPERGRRFSGRERTRIRQMIGEGYGSRAFSDLVVPTGSVTPDVTLARLLNVLRDLRR